MGFELHKTWAGVGIKGGGFLFIVGADTFEGTAFRLDQMPYHSLHELNITSLRAGLGLGGGAGVSLFFAFNVNTLWEINDKTMQDWGVNISLPGEKIGVGKWTYPILKQLTTGAELLKNFDAKRLADMRQLASLFYSVMYDVGGGLNGSQWSAVVIDVPEAGWAAELSAYASWGEITVGDRIGGSA